MKLLNVVSIFRSEHQRWVLIIPLPQIWKNIYRITHSTVRNTKTYNIWGLDGICYQLDNRYYSNQEKVSQVKDFISRVIILLENTEIISFRYALEIKTKLRLFFIIIQCSQEVCQVFEILLLIFQKSRDH